MSRILVIGAGIVGLSVARAAVKRGHAVQILEQGPAPNPQAASYDNHRMIRYPYGAAEGYTRMVAEAFPAWDRLWDDLGQRHFEDTGAIAISLEPGDYAEKSRDTLARLGLPHEVLDRDAVEALCPHLTLPAQAWGVVSFPGGPLFANRIIDELTAWLLARGVVVTHDAKVTSVDTAQGRATLADGREVTADHVIVAAGAWLPRLMPERFADLPVYRQALLYAEPPPRYAQSWREAPAIAVIGDHSGYTLPDRRGAGFKLGYGAHRRRAMPDEAGFGADLEAESAVILGAFKPYFNDFALYRPLRMQVGYYVLHPSRHFLLERLGAALVVTHCDGQMFKFGPLMGERILDTLDGRLAMSDLARWAAGH